MRIVIISFTNSSIHIFSSSAASLFNKVSVSVKCSTGQKGQTALITAL